MKLQVCIVDDQLPISSEIEPFQLIESHELLALLANGADWPPNEGNLGSLLSHLLESDGFKQGRFELKWALDPAICLNAVGDGYKPDLIVLDWIYRHGPHGRSTVSFLERLLNETSGFVFIFSTQPDVIPAEILSRKLHLERSRVRLLQKSKSLGVMMADELIGNWVIVRTEENPVVSIMGKRLSFRKSDGLVDPSDLLYLNDLLDPTSIQNWLDTLGQSIGAQEVFEALKDVNKNVIVSPKGFLILPEERGLIEKYGTGEKVDYASAAAKYGLANLWRAHTEGIAPSK